MLLTLICFQVIIKRVKLLQQFIHYLAVSFTMTIIGRLTVRMHAIVILTSLNKKHLNCMPVLNKGDFDDLKSRAIEMISQLKTNKETWWKENKYVLRLFFKLV